MRVVMFRRMAAAPKNVLLVGEQNRCVVGTERGYQRCVVGAGETPTATRDIVCPKIRKYLIKPGRYVGICHMFKIRVPACNSCYCLADITVTKLPKTYTTYIYSVLATYCTFMLLTILLQFNHVTLIVLFE